MLRILYVAGFGCLLIALAVFYVVEEKPASPEKIDVSAAAQGNKQAGEKPASPVKPDVPAVVQGTNQFAFDLYRKLAGQDKAQGNVVFSPYSNSNALAMTYAGARGETAERMAKVLHFTLPPERLHPSFGELIGDLQKDGKDRPYQFHVANSLWGQKGSLFLDEFLRHVRGNYGAGLQEVNFAGDPEEARTAINRWVEKETQNKIEKLLLPGNVTSMTRLFLVNAIYFKANWQAPFPKDQTKDALFEAASGEKAMVPMMHHKEERFRYYAGDGFQWLELPYQGGRLSMVVLLPQKKGQLAELEKRLTATAIQKGVEQLRIHSGPVFLPRFKVTFRLSLLKDLAAMGMPLDPFDGMISGKSLRISEVIHKSYVEVDEAGTEAAAATAIELSEWEPPQLSFRADHPFLFLLRDNRTGTILFLGRVSEVQR